MSSNRSDLFYSKLTYTELFEMFKSIYCSMTGEESYTLRAPKGRAEAVAWIEDAYEDFNTVQC